MAEQPVVSTVPSASFTSFGAAAPRADTSLNGDRLPKPSVKHTLFTCTLLVGYVAGYATVGYTMVIVVVRLWTALFH